MSASSHLREVSTRVRSLPERTVRVGADAFNEAIAERVRKDTGGDARLSGFGRRGKRVATTTRVSGGGRVASVVIRMRGPQAAILERGAQPHVVGRRRDGKGGLHMTPGGDWRTGPFRVSGSPAKRTFTLGVEAGRARARDAMQDELRKALA